MLTPKIGTVENVARRVRELQTAGQRVVFANGCFDILHGGHIELFQRAREHGDQLVIAINSDASVKRLKGDRRPIFDQEERAELLAAMEMVDFVCVFEENTPLETIMALHPDVLVKGADWRGKVVGQEEVEGWGGKVVTVDLVRGQSTTSIVQRVVSQLGKVSSLED